MAEPYSRPNLKLPLLVFIIFALLGIWLINTLNTGNVFWFLPFQPEYRPARIVIRDYGTAVTLRPGDEGYEELVAGINQSFSNFRNTSLIDLGLSDETLQGYQEQELVIELYYNEFITFNTPVRMSGVNQLLIPVDARHAGRGYVFLGRDGAWRVGAMQVSDSEPILTAMRELGYLREG